MKTPDDIIVFFFNDGRAPMVVDATISQTVTVPASGVARFYAASDKFRQESALTYGAGGAGGVAAE